MNVFRVFILISFDDEPNARLRIPTLRYAARYGSYGYTVRDEKPANRDAATASARGRGRGPSDSELCGAVCALTGDRPVPRAAAVMTSCLTRPQLPSFLYGCYELLVPFQVAFFSKLSHISGLVAPPYRPPARDIDQTKKKPKPSLPREIYPPFRKILPSPFQGTRRRNRIQATASRFHAR